MNRFFYCLLIVLLITSCQTKQEGNVKGIVIDATMNTITILTEESDTLMFSTLNADKTQVDGILINDTAQIFYKYNGNYKDGAEATKFLITPANKLIGGDKDVHGCLRPAGYTWSELKQDCVRLFEIGVRLQSVSNQTESAFIITSDNMEQVELFTPNDSPSLLFYKNGQEWKSTQEKGYVAYLQDNLWVIQKNFEVIYKQVLTQDLGELQTVVYDGISKSGKHYLLKTQNYAYSGDGSFNLEVDGKEQYSGKRWTQRGAASDNDATVW